MIMITIQDCSCNNSNKEPLATHQNTVQTKYEMMPPLSNEIPNEDVDRGVDCEL